MKDSRFLELLNLYVDREISPSEATELEAEVQRSSARRQVFDLYARMDRACTIVLSQPAPTPAPKLAAALAEAERKVTEFPSRTGPRSTLIFVGGLMAAAAAVAVVLVNRDAMPAAIPAPAPRAVQMAVKPASTPLPTGREASVALPIGGSIAPLAADRPSLAWLAKMDLPRPAPLSDEDLMLVARTEKSFSSHLTWGLHRENALFPKAGVTRPPTELNAFELRK